MKKTILIVIVVGMLGFAVYDFALSSEEKTIQKKAETISDNTITSPPKGNEKEKKVVESNEVGLDVGEIAPDFELSTLDGGTVKLSDFRGQRVMLNFWATWCPPCRAEMPDMQKFYDNKDVVILAVNLTGTESGTKEVQKFVDEFGLTFPILLDKEMSVSDQYQIQPIPTTFMIDSEGRIQKKSFGAQNYELMVQEFEKMQ
ncbi:alkyl hydroperoxide reductase [Virgibacillus phasianinus]|uniref:Alkyl hydroperoxide reductase n=1 Tax=Virgibacillus phasianinus TaxID=2017483 RepID=A0A220TZQ4_9BACI|nr:redoxin domain-containing protein [Virgibacillus phasianinus]ASK61318.1 alkyl hydroperoxide reductase [Virgibacillus phasianinus]